MNNNTGTTILALLTGAVIGAGAGILFAPNEGKKTRKQIKKTFDEQTKKMDDKFKEFSETVKSKINKGTLEDKVEDLLSSSSYKAEEVIVFLEKKLANLKEANAKLQK